jgi:hypothetical protein
MNLMIAPAREKSTVIRNEIVRSTDEWGGYILFEKKEECTMY